MTTTRHTLRMEGISKSFGTVNALKDVTFTAIGGQIHVLCGENGAGKSTLMKILAGNFPADQGSIFLDERKLSFHSPSDALNAGISMLYQELDLADDLKVYENIFLGHEMMSGFKMDDRAMIDCCRQLFQKYGFDLDPEAEIRELPMGACQIVELMKAIRRKASVIVMDEPTSSLSQKEITVLFDIIARLKADGMIIIYISHHLEEIMQLADVISILRDGQVVHSAPSAELDIPSIVKYMVGRQVTDFYPSRKVNIGEIKFEARNLTGANGVSDVSFQVRKGEILGFAGLVGAGRSETADLIFGVSPLTSGSLWMDGRQLSIHNPADAIRAGIAYLTEDRKRTGLCVELPCSWNLTLPNLTQIGMGKVLDLAREINLCHEYEKQISIRWQSPDSTAAELSGGNQQKVLVARWLMAHSQFLIFDEPTRGIDVGAKVEIYTILNYLAAQGNAILVISSDLPELLGICDRICVMRNGRLCASFDKAEATSEKIMEMATTVS